MDKEILIKILEQADDVLKSTELAAADSVSSALTVIYKNHRSEANIQ
jgi:hypothetical protein